MKTDTTRNPMDGPAEPSAPRRVVAGMTIGVTSYDHTPIYAGDDMTYGQAVDKYIENFYSKPNDEDAMISEIRIELDPDAQRALRDIAMQKLY